MGLGKTLTTLALVAVNQPAGIVLGPAPTEAEAEAAEAETAAASDEVAEAAAEAGEGEAGEGAAEFDAEEETRRAKRLRVPELREELAAHGQVRVSVRVRV